MPTVLVTGAGRGLGLEFARQYSLDGWRVIATARDPSSAESLRAFGPNVEIHRLDVTDRSAIAALAVSLSDDVVDVMIANAGVMTTRPEAPVAQISEPAWLEAFRVNTIAPLMCANAFLKQVARSRQRKILAMSSWIGSITCNTAGGHYVYRASKSALNAVWRSFAIDHPEVIVALLSPGALRTDMTRYDCRWETLPEPVEHVRRLREIVAGMTQVDSGSFFHFDGQRLPW